MWEAEQAVITTNGDVMAEAKKEVKKSKVVSKQIKDKKVPQSNKPEVSKTKLESTKGSKVEDTSDKASKDLAKAGKRSAKAVKEAETKQVKEERKLEASDDQKQQTDEPKKTQKPSSTRLERRSKSYKKAYEFIDKNIKYEVEDGLTLAIKTNPVKFDATVELHLNLNVDPKQADQNIRGTVVLPAGTGKSSKVAVFGDADEVAAAKKAGADIAAGDEFLQQLDKGLLNFDVLVATPRSMPQLGKYAKLLGPKGLMPNPKSGTVTTDVAKAVKEAKAGKVEFRVDSTGIIHVGTGKISFGSDKLMQNLQQIISAVKSAKPASIKGVYIKSAYLTTSMGPSIKINI